MYPTISGNDDIWWFGGYDQSGYGYNMVDDLSTDSYGDNVYWQIDVNPAAISEGNDTASDFDIVPNGDDADAGGGFSGAVTCATVTVNGVSSQVDACFSVLEPRYLQVPGPELFVNSSTCNKYFQSPGFCDVWQWQILDETGAPLPYPVDAHELFPADPPPVTDYTGNPASNWIPGSANGTTTTGSTFYDVLGKWSSYWVPSPIPGTSCPGSTKMLHWTQQWWVGTAAVIASGILVQTDLLQFCQDCAMPVNY